MILLQQAGVGRDDLYHKVLEKKKKILYTSLRVEVSPVSP